MITSETITKIAPALLKAQKMIGAAEKDSANPFYKSNFASLGAVMEACKKALNDNGLLVMQPVGVTENGNQYVETVILHESGEYISDRMKLVAKAENDPQAQGSATSYAKRYGLQAMLFIPTSDDDAEGVMRPQPKLKPKVATAPKPVAESKVFTNNVKNEEEPEPAPRMITEGQRKYMWSLLNGENTPSTAEVYEMYGVTSLNDVTFAQAHEFLEKFGQQSN